MYKLKTVSLVYILIIIILILDISESYLKKKFNFLYYMIDINNN